MSSSEISAYYLGQIKSSEQNLSEYRQYFMHSFLDLSNVLKDVNGTNYFNKDNSVNLSESVDLYHRKTIESFNSIVEVQEEMVNHLRLSIHHMITLDSKIDFLNESDEGRKYIAFVISSIRNHASLLQSLKRTFTKNKNIWKDNPTIKDMMYKKQKLIELAIRKFKASVNKHLISIQEINDYLHLTENDAVFVIPKKK